MLFVSIIKGIQTQVMAHYPLPAFQFEGLTGGSGYLPPITTILYKVFMFSICVQKSLHSIQEIQNKH